MKTTNVRHQESKQQVYIFKTRSSDAYLAALAYLRNHSNAYVDIKSRIESHGRFVDYIIEYSLR